MPDSSLQRELIQDKWPRSSSIIASGGVTSHNGAPVGVWRREPAPNTANFPLGPYLIKHLVNTWCSSALSRRQAQILICSFRAAPCLVGPPARPVQAVSELTAMRAGSCREVATTRCRDRRLPTPQSLGGWQPLDNIK